MKIGACLVDTTSSIFDLSKSSEILSKEISQSKHDTRIRLIGPLILEIQQKIAEVQSVNHEIVQKDIHLLKNT